MSNEVELIFSARDNASQAIAKFNRSIGEDSSAAAGKFGRGLREAIQPMQAMGQEVLARLNPAMAGAVSQFSLASREAARLPVVLGAVTVGVAAVSAAAGVYIERLKEAQDFQVRFNTATKAADLGTMRSLLGDTTAQLERFSFLARQSAQEMTGLGSAMEVVVSYWQRLLEGGDSKVAELERRSAALRKAMGPLLVSDAAIAAAGIQAQQFGIRQGMVAQRLGVAVEEGRPLTATDAILGQMRSLAQQRAAAEIDKLREQGKRERQALTAQGLSTFESQRVEDQAVEAVKTALKAELQQITLAGRKTNIAAIGRLGPAMSAGVAQWEGFEGTLLGGVTPADQDRIWRQAEAIHLAGVEKLREQFDADLAHGEGAGAEAITAGVSSADRAAIYATGLKSQREALDLARQRAEILSHIVGLSEQERASVELQVIEAERRLKIADAQNDAEKENLANLEAAVRSDAIRRAELERTDLWAGVAKGFRDVNDDVTSFGRTGADAVRQFATTAQQAMSDLLFMPMERGWKRTLEELPRQMGLNIYRVLTDAVARFSLGTLTRSLGLGGGGILGMVSGFGAGMPGIVNVTGAGVQQLAALQSAGYQVTSVGGQTVAIASPVSQAGVSGISLSNVPLPPMGSLMPSGGALGEFLGSPLFQQSMYAYGWTPTGTAVMGSEEMMYAPALSGGAAGGMTVAQALGIAGGAVGLGWTVYTALQGPPTAENMAMSGMSGAMAGAMIGSYFGPYGTVAGLVIGAAIGAGAAALGKGPNLHDYREQKEAARATGVAQQFIDAVNATRDPDELYATIAMYNTGYVGGRSEVAINTTVNGKFVGTRAGVYPLATVDELMNNPDGVRCSVQAGVRPDLLSDANRACEDAIRHKIDELVNREASIPFGWVEDLGGYSRQTLVPLRALDEARGQRNVIYSSQVLRQDLRLSDDDIEQIARRIKTVSYDRALTDWSRDDFWPA